MMKGNGTNDMEMDKLGYRCLENVCLDSTAFLDPYEASKVSNPTPITPAEIEKGFIQIGFSEVVTKPAYDPNGKLLDNMVRVYAKGSPDGSK